jgi:hypothetical protein
VDVTGAIRLMDRLAKYADELRDLQASVPYTSDHYTEGARWKKVKALLDELVRPCERIARAVDPRLADELIQMYDRSDPENLASTARQVIGRLRTDDVISEIIGPQGPQLAATNLHPWIWEPAARLWNNDHRREALQAAATALFDQWTPAKLGRERDARGGKDLMGQAFSTKDPESGSPRLRIPGYDRATNLRDWTSAHEGAMELGQGAAQLIRNLMTHSLEAPGEQRALEMLAVLSLVARLVDEANVEQAP